VDYKALYKKFRGRDAHISAMLKYMELEKKMF